MKFLSPAITQKIGRQALLTSKNSPSILFGAGLVGMVGSTVLACRATLRLQEVLEQAESDLHVAENMEHPDYSENDRKKDKAIIITRSAVAVGRLYAPAIGAGAFSVLALTRSHQILNERNAALAAAYTAVDKAFALYRSRVVDKYGEEEDQHLRYGTREEIVEVPDKKHGFVQQSRTRVGDDAPSMYARFFDQLSAEWSKEPEYNLVFLGCQQTYANDMLKTRGHLFLNEVYDMLGIKRTKAGQVVGWVISDDGDNYIDFGIWKADDPNARDFVNGREGAILLDFNVDGVIYDKIGHQEERIRWQS